jgi:hypothetical protein
VHDWANAYEPRTILIEDKASGIQLFQELQREGLQGVTRYQPKMDKIMRLHSVTSTIESGLVHLPTEAEWLDAYLHELTTFPNGKYDDQADSTSQALDWIKSGCFADGLCRYYEKQAINMGLPASAAYESGPTFLDDARLERLTRAAIPRIFQWKSY